MDSKDIYENKNIIKGINNICDNPIERNSRTKMNDQYCNGISNKPGPEEHLIHDYMEVHPDGEQKFMYGYLDYMSSKGKHLKDMIAQDNYKILYVEFIDDNTIQYLYSSTKNDKNKLIKVFSLGGDRHGKLIYGEIYAQQTALRPSIPTCSNSLCQEKFKLCDKFCKYHGPLISYITRNSTDQLSNNFTKYVVI